MPKRFTDTEIWRRPWYRALSLAEREAWKYITDTCDQVGVWIFDPEGAEQNIGEKIDWASLPSKLHNNIEILSDSKWWVKDFCFFQYGILDPKAKANVTQFYISLLKKHGLWEWYQDGISMVSQAPKTRKGKGQEEEKEEEEEKEGVPSRNTLKLLKDAFPNLNLPDAVEG